MLGRRVPAEKDGREGDQGRQDPHVRQHEEHGPLRHVQRVLERTYDGEVSARNAKEKKKRKCGWVKIYSIIFLC